MLRYAKFVAALPVLLLAGCHTCGGYMSADPELTYGPGVVEFEQDFADSWSHGGRYLASSGAPSAAAPHLVHDVEIVFEEPLPRRHPVAPLAPTRPVYEHVPSAHVPPGSSGDPAKYGRRVRRAPGQPLGVEFTD